MITRRALLKASASTVALAAVEMAAPAVVAAAVPRLGCGCPRIHAISYGYTCCIHDETGKRWDAYTLEEIVEGHFRGLKIDVVAADSEWNCYCGKCDGEEMPVGTRCVWEKVSYEYDEWEVKCEHGFKADWLASVTIDWIAMAKEEGFA